MALGLTLTMSALFVALFRAGQGAFRVEPELSALRLDAQNALDRIGADLLRAGSGLPVEIPVFTNLGPAGNRNPDGLDFLAAPERLAASAFEPVIAFDGAEVTLEEPASRFAAARRSARSTWAVVFNDDEMLPRWVFGRVAAVSGAGGGSLNPGAGGARVRLAAASNSWHVHFNPLVDADTFAPGGGGGLLERGLDSLLGGVISSLLPGTAPPALAALTSQVVGTMVEGLAKKAGRKLPTKGKAKGGGGNADQDDDDGFGLFGLGRPGLVPVERIRYRVAPAPAGAADRRSVLMRRVNDAPAQPVGFVEDLQVRYLTGETGDTARDDPPGFIGDVRTAAALGRHVVRGIEVSIRVRSPQPAGPGGEPLTRTWRRRIGLRVAAAGVDRRQWEEKMQLKALPTDIPRIGPLRYIPLPW